MTETTRRYIVDMLVFSLLGPPIGLLVTLVMPFLIGIKTSIYIPEIGVLLVLCLVAYGLGLVPALLTGALHAFWRSRIDDPVTVTFLVAGVGWASSGVTLFLILLVPAVLFGDLPPEPDRAGQLAETFFTCLLYGVSGAIAALVCRLVLRVAFAAGKPAPSN